MLKKIAVVGVSLFLLLCLISCSPSDDGNEDLGEQKINAYIIKIDGKEVGYIKNEEQAKEIADAFTEEKRKALEASDAEIIKITVNSVIESEPGLCYEDELMSAEQITKKYYENGGKISFSITVSEKEKAYISFETVYKNSSAYYEGTKVVSTKGSQGEREKVFEVTYTDGVESSRELISDTVTKKAVDEVVLVGTKKSTASSGKYAWPLKSVTVTSPYGGRTLNGSYDFHFGVDLRAASGTSVYAADGGKVTYAGYMGSYGYLVKIQHDNGDYTYYAHLSKISVSVGSRVYKGQLIAKSGATGNVTGPHLHFEIRKSGSTVNPVNYLPSFKNVRVDYSASLESCLGYKDAYLFRSAPRAFLSSKREQEA